VDLEIVSSRDSARMCGLNTTAGTGRPDDGREVEEKFRALARRPAAGLRRPTLCYVSVGAR